MVKDCVPIDEVGHSVSPGVGGPLAPHVSGHVVGGGGGGQRNPKTLRMHTLVLLHLKACTLYIALKTGV